MLEVPVDLMLTLPAEFEVYKVSFASRVGILNARDQGSDRLDSAVIEEFHRLSNGQLQDMEALYCKYMRWISDLLL